MSGRTLLRLGLGIGLLGLVLARADLAEVRRSLQRAHVGWLGAALLAQLVAKALWAARWSTLLRAAGHARRAGELFGIVLVGLFFGSFLPSSVGGDVARGWALAARGVPRAAAAASVLADRLVGVVALAVAATVGAVMASANGAERSAWLSAAASAVVFAGAIGVALRPELLGRLATRLPASIAQRARRVADAFTLVAGRGDLVLGALALSIGLVAFSVVYHWSLAQAIDVHVSFAAWLVIVPAVMLLSAVPLTPNGIGFREAGFVGFLSAQGVPASQATLFAVLALVLPLPFSLAGGLLFAAGGDRGRPARAEEGGTS